MRAKKDDRPHRNRGLGPSGGINPILRATTFCWHPRIQPAPHQRWAYLFYKPNQKTPITRPCPQAGLRCSAGGYVTRPISARHAAGSAGLARELAVQVSVRGHDQIAWEQQASAATRGCCGCTGAAFTCPCRSRSVTLSRSRRAQGPPPCPGPRASQAQAQAQLNLCPCAISHH